MAEDRPSFVDLSDQLVQPEPPAQPSVMLPPEPDEAVAALEEALALR